MGMLKFKHSYLITTVYLVIVFSCIGISNIDMESWARV